MVTAVATEPAPVEAGEQAPQLPEAVRVIRLQLPDCWELTDERLLKLCALNEGVRIETDCEGALLIMSPSGTGTGIAQGQVIAQIVVWANQLGDESVAIDDGFVRLSEQEFRAPDAAWISAERIAELGTGRNAVVWAVVPDLIVEIVSANDDLEDQQAKMEMWLDAGARLGWLIDPFSSTAWIYRPERDPEQLDRPLELRGEDVAVGLTVSLARVWRSASEE